MSAERNDKPRDIHERLMEFALRILRMYEALPSSRAAQHAGYQVVKSGTSVGAQMREARRARSNAEFISKCESSQQEMDETTFWLELIVRAGWLPDEQLGELLQESDELLRILATMAIHAKKGARVQH